jgi:3-oxoacyl-[acyl-carrier-protein] synthase-3
VQLTVGELEGIGDRLSPDAIYGPAGINLTTNGPGEKRLASGAHLPQTVVSNEQLAEQLGLTPDQIYKSSGIRERRWASRKRDDKLVEHRALKKNGVTLDEIDYLILGTKTADRFIPGSAPMVQTVVGLREIPCLDIRAACCNTLYGLQLSSALVTGWHEMSHSV